MRGIAQRGAALQRGLLAGVFAPALLALSQPSIAREVTEEDVADMSIEQLMDLEVTSVSKRPERLLSAPAAVQVVTGDDIRRAGAPNIPEALRLTGQLDVAQKNAHEWVISARGFSSDVGNKLLVLMDGRTVYTPLFSGVFWDRQDYLLEDIERIEAISGPGGTLWGANAVNGVINITTKNAEATQGFYAEGGGGTGPNGFVGARYGGSLAPDVFFRVYGKYTDYPEEAVASGAGSKDAWNTSQAGFRIDAAPGDRDRLTLQGDVTTNNEGIQSGGKANAGGGNLLGRWSRTFSEHSDMSLQVYYDHTHLRVPVPAAFLAPAGTLKDDLDTVDVDFQHRFRLNENNNLLWGLGYRYTHDDVQNAPGLGFFPAKLNQSLYSAFVQDEITLTQNIVVTLGTKVEHMPYTGVEWEPSARVQWTPVVNQAVWGAVSRAVRAPSRIDRDLSQPIPGYLLVILKGAADFRSETLVAYELGYRAHATDKLLLAVSGFYNVYDDLRSTSTSVPAPPLNLPFPFYFQNNLRADTYGAELTATWQVMDGWRLRGSYRLLDEKVRVKPGKTDFNNALNETADPEHQASLNSSAALGRDLSLDANLRWVDVRVINNSGTRAKVPAYFELDTRLAWDIPGPFELSVAGRNLLHARHPEYSAPSATRVEPGRGVYGKLTWHY